MFLARNLLLLFFLISLSSVFAAEDFLLKKSEAAAGLPRTPSKTPPPLSTMSPPPPRSPMSPPPDDKATPSHSPGEAQLRLELASAQKDLVEAELASTRARLRITTAMNALQRKYSASHDASFQVDIRLLHIPASPPPSTDLNEESKRLQQARAAALLSPGTRQARFEALMSQEISSRRKAVETLFN
jgi:hypothetical protein